MAKKTGSKKANPVKKKAEPKSKEKTKVEEKAKEKIVVLGKISKEEALKKAEERLGKAVDKVNKKESKEEEDIETKSLEDFDDDMTLGELKKLEKQGIRIIYPNLKYKKPKYENVGDILKYVESEGDKGEGVRIVIMNFND